MFEIENGIGKGVARRRPMKLLSSGSRIATVGDRKQPKDAEGYRKKIDEGYHVVAEAGTG